MNDKTAIAQALADAHRGIEPSIVRIRRITSPDESDPSEPVKLLEVNPDTSPSGIVPIYFGPSSKVPAPSVLVEITPKEYDDIERGDLKLPPGWKLDVTLFDGTREPHHAGS